jgi:hypothetical protein
MACGSRSRRNLDHTKAAAEALATYLARVPAVKVLGTSAEEEPSWWLKLTIDIDHPLSWHVVQELGHVLNYLSVSERLPTAFKPVSPPPYMNGGPKDFLSWVIEATDDGAQPDTITKWLEGRLPRPEDDLAKWNRRRHR